MLVGRAVGGHIRHGGHVAGTHSLAEAVLVVELRV